MPLKNKKNLTAKQQAPVIRKTSISLPELHEEQLTGGIADTNAIAPLGFFDLGDGWCSFDGDDA
jgi:hypothetical protein